MSPWLTIEVHYLLTLPNQARDPFSRHLANDWLTSFYNSPFIYDIQIYPDFQNQGFGTQALKLIATQAKALGFKSLGLHVFGHNKRAIHVYEKSGF
ncbi:GNAT family N-acetyltransferase [Limosilactobacillus fermentum]|nr:GNAT family N-acetyltransferase [Limosilactobacillus fermentum]RDG17148.1 hypothetical protein DQM14_08710 [Limosilactobacillus fermentum]TLQ35720.1 GNAT family N-acetyltransferase [Limosilactobacillus fermentum]